MRQVLDQAAGDLSQAELDRARALAKAGLLMALTYVGGDNAATNLGLPVAAISAFQGMLLFFLLAVDVLTNFRVKVGRPRAPRTGAAPGMEAAE